MNKITSEKKSKPKVALKNYIYAGLILVGGILLVQYIFKWVEVKNEEKLMTSYLISSNTINSSIDDLNTLEQILKETSSSYFIYFGYTKDENVYNFEKKLKRIIDNYNLSDNFYYVDLTDIKEKNNNYLEDIKNKLKINNLDRVPAIIYVKDGVTQKENILDGIDNSMIKAEDLENLLEIYEFDKIK